MISQKNSTINCEDKISRAIKPDNIFSHQSLYSENPSKLQPPRFSKQAIFHPVNNEQPVTESTSQIQQSLSNKIIFDDSHFRDILKKSYPHVPDKSCYQVIDKIGDLPQKSSNLALSEEDKQTIDFVTRSSYQSNLNRNALKPNEPTPEPAPRLLPINITNDSTPPLNQSVNIPTKNAILNHLFYLINFDKSVIFLGKKTAIEKSSSKKFCDIFKRTKSCMNSSDQTIDNASYQQQDEEYVFVTKDQFFLITCQEDEIKNCQTNSLKNPCPASQSIDLKKITNDEQIRQFLVANSDILNSFKKNLQNKICQASQKLGFKPSSAVSPEISCTLVRQSKSAEK